jgi:hypothetical protein
VSETTFNDDATAYLAHVGVLHKSGRYPWGSGKDPHQRNQLFLDHVASLRRSGLSEVAIAESMGIKTSELRAAKSIAKNEQKAANERKVMMLREKGMGWIAISERLGIPEATVRSLADPSNQAKTSKLTDTADFLMKQVDEKGFIDVGEGVENYLDMSKDQLHKAVAIAREKDYKYYHVKVPQVTSGNETTMKILAPPGTPYYPDVVKNLDKIQHFAGWRNRGEEDINRIVPPTNVSSSRIEIKHGPDGGADKDGVIEIRRGVDDISMGSARYAQVRIAVDGSHYLKGMAMYADDLPDGVDMRFNTNKTLAETTAKAAKEGHNNPKLGAMKPQNGDPEEPNPFGAVIRQKYYIDPADGKRKLSALNIVNEEGKWTEWSSNLSSQVLSKQSNQLAKKQLDLALKGKQDELEEIMSLTNPTVKKKLLQSFSDDADSSSVHLKAAGLPRQSTNVILPITSMKQTEIYAPKYKDGERVVLIRYPHGGIFEIPELVVNNKQPEANRLIKNAADAVGIHPKVAERLSGADFDGDTVLVIPNNDRRIKTAPALKGLEGFSPTAAYPAYEGMKPMSPKLKQQKMGDVSNLITDMTIKGATDAELARAVRHSMVVIDAEKHKLNWKQSQIDNGIAELKSKYQQGPKSGADTLISRASSRQDVENRELRKAAQGGPIDKATGKLVYVPKDNSYVNKAGETVPGRKIRSTKMAETDDARTLISEGNYVIENVYADHANSLKALANKARKELVTTPNLEYHGTAAKVYAKEVADLDHALNLARRNAPLERQAQIVAGTIVKAKLQAKPEMDSAELKKVKGRALVEARGRVGAGKDVIDITPDQWKAIQAGAISHTKLDDILRNANVDKVKELATPREIKVMTPTKVARAKAMAAAGFSSGQIAETLGVSASAVNSHVNQSVIEQAKERDERSN